ncbi:MAG TPA: glutamine-synthetase adenylyltransferase, partial [Magnetovibrio sp.]
MQLFEFNSDNLPGCASDAHAQVGWERFVAAAQGDAELHSFAAALEASPAGLKLARVVFGNSPFLTACWLNDLQFTKALLQRGPDAMRDEALSATRNWDRSLDEPGLMRLLRRQKVKMALITAIADITQVWELFGVTHALSDFADAAVSAAVSFQLMQLDRRGKIKLKHPDQPERESGLVILGMGKLGGRELNYSSDIDLIVLFDAERIETEQPMELSASFVRLARGLVEMLDKRTGDGYVFRTDLRLRPDPGSTPLAISTRAAEIYYESIGQNWERAAMIKARPIAGDLDAGQEFLDILRPYVWRKHLDFAAIQDIQSIKRQINAHKGGSTIKIRGHNVKLGRGGIREIEFYAQTQQLIWGGRERDLRVKPTLEALNALVEAGHEQAENARTLSAAYHFLRRVEHRLQMIDDAQTHTLPEDDEGLHDIAIFLGYPTYDAFASDILATMSQVETLYAALFEEGQSLGAEGGGSLVFTGGESDPETLKTIRDMGYQNAEAVDAAVRGWHHARYRATRSTRAREILTELMPRILSAMAGTAEPDAAFMRFDAFLGQLPAGVQLFSMFQSNPQML